MFSLHVPAFALVQGTLSYLFPLSIPNPAPFHAKRATGKGVGAGWQS